MKCQNCGNEIRSGVKFCEMCGTKVQFFCPACGTENDSTSAFCLNCGTALNPAPQKKVHTNILGRGATTGEALNEATGLRAILASPAMLFGCLLLSLALVFSLYSQSGILRMILSSDLYDYIYELAYWTGVDVFDELDSLLTRSAFAAGGLSLVGILKQWPLLTVVIGLWMSWGAARNTVVNPMKDGGLKAIRFVVGFFFVVYVLAMIAFVCVMIYAIIELSGSWFAEEFVGPCVLILAVGAVAFVIICNFYKKAMDALAEVCDGLQKGKETCDISGGLIVMLCIVGIGSAIGTLFSIGQTNMAGFFSGACYAAGLLLFGNLLKRCKEPATESRAHQDELTQE